jgi:octaprenyl-diphosphate synthase
VIAFVKQQRGLDYAVAKMKEFQTQALQLLDQYPESEFKSALILMVNYVIDRKK